MRPSSSVKSKISLHVGLKLFLSIVVAWASLALRRPEALGILLGLSVLYAGLLVNHKTLLKTYLVLAISALIYISFARVLSNIPTYGMFFMGSIGTLLIPFYRLGIATSTALALAFSTDMGELLRELNRLRIPRFISIPISVAVRFLPTFWEDVASIRDVNKLRFNGQSFFRQLVLHPVRFWRTFCVPLIFRALHSADALALSATLKGVGTKGGLATLPKAKVTVWDGLVLLVWVGGIWLAFTWQSTLIALAKGASNVH